jgi:hypothetical protein
MELKEDPLCLTQRIDHIYEDPHTPHRHLLFGIMGT